MRQFLCVAMLLALAATAPAQPPAAENKPPDDIEYSAIPEAVKRRWAELEAEIAALEKKVLYWNGKVPPRDVERTAESVHKLAMDALEELLIQRERVDNYLRENRLAEGVYKALAEQFEKRLKDYEVSPDFGQRQPRDVVAGEKDEVRREITKLTGKYHRVTKFRAELDKAIDQARTAALACRDVALAHKVRSGMDKDDIRKGGQDSFAVLSVALQSFLRAAEGLRAPPEEETMRKLSETTAEAERLKGRLREAGASADALRREHSAQKAQADLLRRERDSYKASAEALARKLSEQNHPYPPAGVVPVGPAPRAVPRQGQWPPPAVPFNPHPGWPQNAPPPLRTDVWY